MQQRPVTQMLVKGITVNYHFCRVFVFVKTNGFGTVGDQHTEFFHFRAKDLLEKGYWQQKDDGTKDRESGRNYQTRRPVSDLVSNCFDHDKEERRKKSNKEGTEERECVFGCVSLGKRTKSFPRCVQRGDQPTRVPIYFLQLQPRTISISMNRATVRYLGYISQTVVGMYRTMNVFIENVFLFVVLCHVKYFNFNLGSGNDEARNLVPILYQLW